MATATRNPYAGPDGDYYDDEAYDSPPAECFGCGTHKHVSRSREFGTDLCPSCETSWSAQYREDVRQSKIPQFKEGDRVEYYDYKTRAPRVGTVKGVGAYDRDFLTYEYDVQWDDGDRHMWKGSSMEKSPSRPSYNPHRNPESRISLTSIGPLSKKDAHKELTKLKRTREGQWIEEETPRGRPWDTESLRRFRNDDEWIEIFQDEGRRGKPWYVRTGKYTSTNPRRNPDLTDHEDELVLYIDNTSSLYEVYKTKVKRLIEMKAGQVIARGGTQPIRYSTIRGSKAFYPMVEQGAQMYRGEIDRSEKWKKSELERIAKDYAERFEREYDSGELAWLGGPARPSNPMACGDLSDKRCDQLNDVYDSARERGYSKRRAAQQARGVVRKQVARDKRKRSRRNPRGGGEKWIRVRSSSLHPGMIVKAPAYVHDFFDADEPKIAWKDWPAYARSSPEWDYEFPDPMPTLLRVDHFDEDEDGESALVAIDENGRELGVTFDWNTGAYPDIWFVEAESLRDAIGLTGRWASEYEQVLRQGVYPPEYNDRWAEWDAKDRDALAKWERGGRRGPRPHVQHHDENPRMRNPAPASSRQGSIVRRIGGL